MQGRAGRTARARAAAGTSKGVSATGGANRCTVVDCTDVNARSPCAPWIRPNPEPLEPPNGSAGTAAKPSTEFTDTAPARSRAAIAAPARRFPQNTAAPRAYRESFTRATASATSATALTATTGPNVSSVVAAASWGTPVSATGAT